MLLPELLPGEERVLYLDVDMIVNQNIRGFYDTDFGGKLFVVSKDQEFDRLLENEKDVCPKRYEIFSALKQGGMTYFCSGMLLMNLEEMRKSNI